MTVYLRPGVNLVENLTALNTATAPVSTAVATFVGASNRGPSIPTLVPDWPTFQNLFGTFTNSAFLSYAVYTYFQNGGTACYVSRPVHSDTLAATKSINDTNGTPHPTISLTAANGGAWGNGVTFDITAGYIAGRFNLFIHFGGSIVEQYQDLTMQPTDARYAPSVINASSNYVVAVDLLTTDTFPNNQPALQTGTALATGADGTPATSSDYTTALNLFANIPTPLILNLPGVVDSPTLAAAQTFVASVANVFQVIDTAPNLSSASAISYAAALTSTSYAAVYYPWINIADPSRPTSSGGATVAVAPGGAVLGSYVANDLEAGPFRTPAGIQASIPAAVSLQTVLQPADLDALNQAPAAVNALKVVPGVGVCIFGGRTLQGGYPSRYIAVRRSLIYIEQSLLNLTQYAVFQPNNTGLWESLSTTVTQWLSDYYGQGGLAGSTSAQAYFVTCDSSNNSPASVQSGVVNISVGVALQFPAEFITITIGQFQGGGSTVQNSLDDSNDE